jgi:hypothetical protein
MHTTCMHTTLSIDMTVVTTLASLLAYALPVDLLAQQTAAVTAEDSAMDRSATMQNALLRSAVECISALLNPCLPYGCHTCTMCHSINCCLLHGCQKCKMCLHTHVLCICCQALQATHLAAAAAARKAPHSAAHHAGSAIHRRMARVRRLMQTVLALA